MSSSTAVLVNVRLSNGGLLEVNVVSILFEIENTDDGRSEMPSAAFELLIKKFRLFMEISLIFVR